MYDNFYAYVCGCVYIMHISAILPLGRILQIVLQSSYDLLPPS